MHRGMSASVLRVAETGDGEDSRKGSNAKRALEILFNIAVYLIFINETVFANDGESQEALRRREVWLLFIYSVLGIVSVTSYYLYEKCCNTEEDLAVIMDNGGEAELPVVKKEKRMGTVIWQWGGTSFIGLLASLPLLGDAGFRDSNIQTSGTLYLIMRIGMSITELIVLPSAGRFGKKAAERFAGGAGSVMGDASFRRSPDFMPPRLMARALNRAGGIGITTVGGANHPTIDDGFGEHVEGGSQNSSDDVNAMSTGLRNVRNARNVFMAPPPPPPSAVDDAEQQTRVCEPFHERSNSAASPHVNFRTPTQAFISGQQAPQSRVVLPPTMEDEDNNDLPRLHQGGR